MTKKSSKDISSKLKAIGIYQIAGGILGLAGIIWFIAVLSTVTFYALVPIFTALVLHSYSIYCGILLIKKKESGLTLSLINQYLQLVDITVFGFGYQYVAGVYLSAGIDWTNAFNFRGSLGYSTVRLSLHADPNIVLINFNFVALFLTIFIDRLKRTINENKMLALVSQFDTA